MRFAPALFVGVLILGAWVALGPSLALAAVSVTWAAAVLASACPLPRTSIPSGRATSISRRDPDVAAAELWARDVVADPRWWEAQGFTATAALMRQVGITGGWLERETAGDGWKVYLVRHECGCRRVWRAVAGGDPTRPDYLIKERCSSCERAGIEPPRPLAPAALPARRKKRRSSRATAELHAVLAEKGARLERKAQILADLPEGSPQIPGWLIEVRNGLRDLADTFDEAGMTEQAQQARDRADSIPDLRRGPSLPAERLRARTAELRARTASALRNVTWIEVNDYALSTSCLCGLTLHRASVDEEEWAVPVGHTQSAPGIVRCPQTQQLIVIEVRAA